MPITFAQPEPFDARLASQLGAARANPYSYAELVNQGTRNILSGYEQAASIAAGRSINDANRATSADMQNADRFAAQADNRERFALARQGQQQENMRLGLEIEARADAINRQDQAQAWLHQQDMSTAEVAKLRQLQNAVGAVNADPNLHPEEKANLILQLRTGIDPMQQRMQAEEQKQLKKRNELLDLTAKAQSAAEADRQTIMTGNLGSLPKMQVGGRELSLAFTGKGYEVVGLDAIKMDMDIQAHRAEQEERLAQRRSEQDAKFQEHFKKLDPGEFDYKKAAKQAVAMALRFDARPPADGDEVHDFEGKKLTNEQFQRVQFFMDHFEQEHAAKQQAHKEALADLTGTPRPAPAAKPEVGGKPVPQQPTPATEVRKTEPTPEQRKAAVTTDIEILRSRAKAAGPAGDGMVRAADEAEKILASVGYDRSKLTAEQRQKLEELARVLAQTPGGQGWGGPKETTPLPAANPQTPTYSFRPGVVPMGR